MAFKVEKPMISSGRMIMAILSLVTRSAIDQHASGLELPDQVRHPMERADRPVDECPQLLPQTADAPLRWIHALAVQASVAVDPMMAMTFNTEHGRNVALRARTAIPLSRKAQIPKALVEPR
jgi:hypothetical protein